MMNEIITATASSIIASIGFSFALAFEILLRIIKKRKVDKDDLPARIKEVSDSLSLSAQRITSLQSELETRIDKVNKLKVEADHAEAIVSLTKKQVSAIHEQLSKDNTKIFWKSVLVNFIFFILGGAASFLISLYFIGK